jgi:hypothetical protein
VITASHTAGLAEYFGRGARSLLLEHSARLNVRLRRDARAKGGFTTECGGEYFAIGVNGAVTGRRADLALIDDPISSTVEADSLAARERLWNWYRTELVPRLKPGAKVLLVMTRWHTDDLAARLMAQGDWKVLRLPAVAGMGGPQWIARETCDARGKQFRGYVSTRATATERQAIRYIQNRNHRHDTGRRIRSWLGFGGSW